MENINLNELRDRAYKTACEHGFHDKRLSNEHHLCLIISELMEAVEADRKGKRADRESFKSSYEDEEPHDDVNFRYSFENYIKGTVEEELADVVIRCLDLAGLRDWDLQDTLDNVDELNNVSDFFQKHTFVEIAFEICTGTIISESLRSIKGVILDVWQYCLWKGIDIEWFIEQKMRYNKLRPKLNGKRY